MFDSEIFKSKFFGLYWHYFLIGSIIYVGARLMLNFFSKSKSPLGYQNEEDVVDNDYGTAGVFAFRSMFILF